jgi:hypothetical protein
MGGEKLGLLQDTLVLASPDYDSETNTPDNYTECRTQVQPD